MKRPAPYAENSPNRYAASQMQQMSAHRMQHHSRMNNYSGRPDSLSTEQGQPRMSSRGEDPRQWDSNAASEMNSVPSHLYPQVDRNPNGEKQVNSDPRLLQSYEQDMEIGCDDKPPSLTFEGLEQKFQDEILKLVKELNDVEDAENVRHREKIVQINNQYREKFLALRSQQANRREELLRKESMERLQLYQESKKVSNDPHLYQQDPHEGISRDPRSYERAGMSERLTSDPRAYQHAGMENDPTGRIPSDLRYQHAGMENHPNQRAPTDPRGYGQRGYGGGQNEVYREKSQYHEDRRSDRSEGRVPYPQGRAYNNAGDRYH